MEKKAYISKLVVEGFKSYGTRRREIPLGEGFIAVVGPNGAGKSNIGDAIAFALGLSTAKTLRAKNLSHLIFSKDGRKAEHALVEVHFKNLGAFPVEEEEERAYEVGGVLHCFTGSYETMRRAVEMGFYISYSGIITYKNAEELREVVKKTPTSRILLETDAPFLSPQPVRGKPNKPTNIFYTAKVLAELLPNTSLQDVDRMTTQNAKNLFNLGEQVKKNTLFYEINGKLYVNLTNRCNLHCAFCQRERERNFWVKGHWVWTERDPSLGDFLREMPPDLSKYKEVVFCGYGEPTLRFSLLKELAKVFKEKGAKRVRVDTNGLLFTFLPKEKLKKLRGLVDAFSVSLNAPDAETYAKVCRPVQEDAFKKVLDFIKEAKRLGFEVSVSAVDYGGVDLGKVEELAKELGVGFRGRHYEVVG
ncbi:radical SAM protein [cyanobacterium G8-9]|nr:radical SAM protein [cyanobacterium G8-9]